MGLGSVCMFSMQDVFSYVGSNFAVFCVHKEGHIKLPLELHGSKELCL